MSDFLRMLASVLFASLLSLGTQAAEEALAAAEMNSRSHALEPHAAEQGEEPAASIVSLEKVLEIAREKAPAISAARARVLQAEGLKFAATVPPDPELRLGTGRGEPRNGGSGKPERSFEILQFLPSPWGLRARSRSSAARVEAAREEVEAITVEVVLEAKRLYYEGAVDEAQALALDQAAQDAKSLRDLVERRVEAGEAPEGDRLRTRVEALRTALEARAAKAEAEGVRAALNRFLLGALGADYSLPSDLDPRRLPPSPEKLVEIAISRNSAYRAALSRSEAAKWAVTAERAARQPGLGLSLFWNRELDRQASGAALSLSIPLWNRNEGAVRTARGDLAEAEAEALELRVQVETEVERLLRRDTVARELAISYRQEIIPAAAEALSIARFSLEQGEASLLSWLEARRSYLEILRASYGSQREAFLTRAELERLTGEFDVPETH